MTGTPPGLWDLCRFYLNTTSAAPLDPEGPIKDWTTLLSPDVRVVLLEEAERGYRGQIDVSWWEQEIVTDDRAVTAPLGLRGLYSWRAKEGSDVAAALASPVTDSPAYTSLGDYYAQYPALLDRSNNDEHYAERLFLENVFVPVLGLAGLQFLMPQVEIRDRRGRLYPDFELDAGDRKYAIEIEGESVRPPSKRDRERVRMRRLASGSDGRYLPYSYSQIQNGEALPDFRDLCQQHVRLRLLVDRPQLLADVRGSLCRTPRHVRWLQNELLDRLQEWTEAGRHAVIIGQQDPSHPLADLALADLLCLVERTCLLMGRDPRDLMVPVCTVVSSWSADSHGQERRTRSQQLLRRYYGSPEGQSEPSDGRNDPALTDWGRVRHTEVVGEGSEPSPRGEPDLTIGPAEVAGMLAAQAQHRSGQAPGQDATALRDELGRNWRPDLSASGILDYFGRRYFHVPRLHEEQKEVIRAFIRGESRLAVLPTGFGKSLCFQLAAHLVPGTVLVVSPLKSLIRDQVESLSAKGLMAVEGITSDDRPAHKSAKLELLLSGQLRLLYVSPERLQSRIFVEEVASRALDAGIWGLAIDEAHCVSEWGHGFRPAYLQVSRFRRKLEAALHLPSDGLPLLALTATASRTTAADMLHLLELPDAEGTVIKGSTQDRPELSLSVHSVAVPQKHKGADTPALKTDALTSLLRDSLPQILGPDAWPPAAGKTPPLVIFTMYADSHGRNTLDHGVAPIKEALLAEGLIPGQQIEVYSSKVPHVCPRCRKPQYLRVSKTEYYCYTCREEFRQRPLPIKPDWPKVVRETQRAFKSDAVSLLVATKGFGMGIDKRNIRAVVHYGFASGLEGYYQEMGRAGRDHRHSHASLIYFPPHPKCVQAVLAGAAPGSTGEVLYEPPCALDRHWRCKWRLSRLCDFGLQAKLLVGDYPGVDQDVKGALGVYRQIRPMFSGGTTPLAIASDGDDEERKREEVALYRLQCLGLVEDYVIEYDAGLNAKLNPELAHPTPEQVRSRLGVTLRRMREADGSPTTDLDQLLRSLDPYLFRASTYWPPSASQGTRTVPRPADCEEPPDEAFLRQCLGLLLAEVYRSIKGMRYRMLHNEWRYAANPDNVCRRAYLLPEFGEQLVPDYQCGFCDACLPDLGFSKAGRAKGAVQVPELQELSRRLSGILRDFDQESIEQALDVCERHQALLSLEAQARHELEGQPANLAAVALAGGAAARRGETDAALQQYGVALQSFTLGRDRNLDLTYFYQRAKELDAVRALALAILSAGLDNADGHAFLLQESREIEGGSERTLRLAAQVALDASHRLADRLRRPSLINDTTGAADA